MPGKIELYILENLSGKIEIFQKFDWKNREFFIRIHDPQISNQIDATAYDNHYVDKNISRVVQSKRALNKTKYSATEFVNETTKPALPLLGFSPQIWVF